MTEATMSPETRAALDALTPIDRPAQSGRPYVFCHMGVSLDGKIMGRYWDVLDDLADSPFYDTAFGPRRAWHHQGWISGRVTTDDNFTHYATPDLHPGEHHVPDGDYLVDTDKPLYYVSIDPHGRLGWSEDVIHYSGMSPKVLEVLTEGVSNDYRAFLRGLHIPYIICRKETVDFAQMLDKLRDDFGFTCVMLGGGGAVNWSMIQQGLCDEVSLVVDPAADGSRSTKSLFRQIDGLSTDDPVRFHLRSVQRVGTNGEQLWLRYDVDNKRIAADRAARAAQAQKG